MKSSLKGRFDTVFFDADDTLWENERYFRKAEEKFIGLLADFATSEEVCQTLCHKQEENIPLFGYGSKTYMVGMTDAAMALCGGSLPEQIYYGIKDIIVELATHELQIIEGVEDTLEQLSSGYRLIVATKGDVTEQMDKFRRSGLGRFFHHCEVMENKDEKNYIELASRNDIAPERLLMIGNSVKSDIVPVVNIGGTAIHIPHEIVWAHEVMDMPDSERIHIIQNVHEIIQIL